MSCAVTLKEFFELIKKLQEKVQKDKPEISETGLVDRIIQIGYNRIPEVLNWEPQHAAVRRESAKEKSVMKEARFAEVMTTLSKNPNMSLDEVAAQISNYGMSMSTIEKVTVLQLQQNRLQVRLLQLSAQQKEFEEFGVGASTREEQMRLSAELTEIETSLKRLKDEYRAIFPKQQVYN